MCIRDRIYSSSHHTSACYHLQMLSIGIFHGHRNSAMLRVLSHYHLGWTSWRPWSRKASPCWCLKPSEFLITFGFESTLTILFIVTNFFQLHPRQTIIAKDNCLWNSQQCPMWVSSHLGLFKLTFTNRPPLVEANRPHQLRPSAHFDYFSGFAQKHGLCTIIWAIGSQALYKTLPKLGGRLIWPSSTCGSKKCILSERNSYGRILGRYIQKSRGAGKGSCHAGCPARSCRNEEPRNLKSRRRGPATGSGVSIVYSSIYGSEIYYLGYLWSQIERNITEKRAKSIKNELRSVWVLSLIHI